MICFWKECAGYTDDIKEIRKVECGYVVIYDNQADEDIFTLYDNYNIKYVSVQNVPLEIVVYDCKNNITIIFRDVIKLEHKDDYWELEKNSEEKLIYDGKGILQQTVNMKGFIHMNDKDVVLLVIHEQD